MGASVEAPEKPRRTRRARKTGPITDQHVTAWTVQMFSIAAMFKRAAHWQVDRPDIEVDPWAGPAAELLNKHLDAALAERAIEANAAVAVAVGVSTMVMKRLQIDWELKRQRAMIAAQQKRQEQERQQVEAPANGRANVSSFRSHTGGAAPTHPEEKLDGLGLNPSGLS